MPETQRLVQALRAAGFAAVVSGAGPQRARARRRAGQPPGRGRAGRSSHRHPVGGASCSQSTSVVVQWGLERRAPRNCVNLAPLQILQDPHANPCGTSAEAGWRRASGPCDRRAAPVVCVQRSFPMTYKGVLVENLSETQNDQSAPTAEAPAASAESATESAPARKRAPRRASTATAAAKAEKAEAAKAEKAAKVGCCARSRRPRGGIRRCGAHRGRAKAKAPRRSRAKKADAEAPAADTAVAEAPAPEAAPAEAPAEPAPKTTGRGRRGAQKPAADAEAPAAEQAAESASEAAPAETSQNNDSDSSDLAWRGAGRSRPQTAARSRNRGRGQNGAAQEQQQQAQPPADDDQAGGKQPQPSAQQAPQRHPDRRVRHRDRRGRRPDPDRRHPRCARQLRFRPHYLIVPRRPQRRVRVPRTGEEVQTCARSDAVVGSIKQPRGRAAEAARSTTRWSRSTRSNGPLGRRCRHPRGVRQAHGPLYPQERLRLETAPRS